MSGVVILKSECENEAENANPNVVSCSKTKQRFKASNESKKAKKDSVPTVVKL